MDNQSNSNWNDPEANKLPEKVEELKENGELPKEADNGSGRKRLVVVGLGMVGVAFMLVHPFDRNIEHRGTDIRAFTERSF